MILAVISMIIVVLENFINLTDIEGITSRFIVNVEDSRLLSKMYNLKHLTI